MPKTKGNTIYNVLNDWARRSPDAVAIVSPGGQPITYGSLLEYIDSIVNSLKAIGVGRNDRVAIVLPDGPEMAVAFLAVASCATSAPLNPSYRESEFGFYLSDLKPRAVITSLEPDSSITAAAKKREIPLIQLSPNFSIVTDAFVFNGLESNSLIGHAFAEADDVALVLYTSGTTSRPKRVPLTHRNLCVSAFNSKAALDLRSDDRCLNVMPLFHIHGLVAGLLSTLASGGSVITPPNFDSECLFDWMNDLRPTWYTAGPTIHHAIIRSARNRLQGIHSSPLRFIRSSSALLPGRVMAELEDIFKVPVIEAYAMTEASYQIASNPLPPRKRKVGSVGIAAGPEVAILGETGQFLPSGKIGEVVIRGKNVIQGYEVNPQANKEAFVNGWFRTGDQGYLDSEGYLYLTGRLKELINRGGEKVSPYEVEAVLMNHPEVSEAVVFPIPHETLGEDVAAALVLKCDHSISATEIQSFAALKIADFKVPRRVLFVEKIPKGPTGKVQRMRLAERLGLKECAQVNLRSGTQQIAPRTTTETEMVRIWRKVLGNEDIGVKDNFFDLGGNSLLAVRLLAEMGQKFGIIIPVATLLQFPTIEQLADNVFQQTKTVSSSLIPVQTEGNRPPFFCMHGYDGYYYLARHLGLNQPFYGLAQHLGGRQVRRTRVEEIAAHYVKEIQTVQPKGPYFIGGHSMGGLIAFEMAQQLYQQSQEVAFLGLFDTAYPKSLKSFPESLSHFVINNFYYFSRLGVQASVRYLSQALHANINWAVKAIICRAYHLLNVSLPPTLQTFYVDKVVYGKLYAKSRNEYVPRLYPGRVTFFKAKDSHDDSQLWRAVAEKGLEIYEVPGDHLSIIEEPYVAVLGKHLKHCLTKTELFGCQGTAHDGLSVQSI